jgi:hypothetical protein
MKFLGFAPIVFVVFFGPALEIGLGVSAGQQEPQIAQDRSHGRDSTTVNQLIRFTETRLLCGD